MTFTINGFLPTIPSIANINTCVKNITLKKEERKNDSKVYPGGPESTVSFKKTACMVTQEYILQQWFSAISWKLKRLAEESQYHVGCM